MQPQPKNIISSCSLYYNGLLQVKLIEYILFIILQGGAPKARVEYYQPPAQQQLFHRDYAVRMRRGRH